MKKLATQILLACLVTLMIDFSLAQLAKVFWDPWDVSKIERKYRVRSSIYHHDLAPKSDAKGAWGIQQY